MAAENAGGSAMMGMGGAGHPTGIKAETVEALICC